MNKVVFIEALGKLIEGLTLIQSSLKEDVPPMAGIPMSAVAVSGESKAVPVTHLPEETAVCEAPPAVPEGAYTREQLDSMPYNEFKKLAARIGVKCTGTREQITGRVLAKNMSADAIPAEEDTAPVTSETAPVTKKPPVRKTKPAETVTAVPPTTPSPTTSAVPTEDTSVPPVAVADKSPSKSDKLPGGKRGLKKATPVPAKDEFDLKADEVAKNTPVDDILFALSEVGVEATAKNYLPKLADALRQNLLSVEDDPADTEDTTNDIPAEDVTEVPEEGTASESETAEETSDDEFDADSYFSQYDPEGFNNPVDMNEKRKDSVVNKMDEILTAVSEGDLTPEAIQTYLEENATQDELDLLGDEPTEDDMLKLYMELQKRMIDNDGDDHEPSDPYELGEYDMCCGHKLKYVAKTQKYLCELCGTEYEAE